MVYVHESVYFALVNFCPFSLPLGVSGWLRLVSVALPGRFYQLYNVFENCQVQFKPCLYLALSFYSYTSF